MRSKLTQRFLILAAAALALCLPVIATAQGGRYPDNRANGRNDERYLRDSVNRLDRLSKDFERDLDRALDHSRVDGTQQEDRINAQAHDFRRAVGNLKSRLGNGRDLNRSSDQARRVLQEADQLNRMARPRWFDPRLGSEWSQIQQELRTISNAYGLRYGGVFRGGRDDSRRNDQNNNDWWRRIPFPQ
jgi:Rad3-related DNA helicase